MTCTLKKSCMLKDTTLTSVNISGKFLDRYAELSQDRVEGNGWAVAAYNNHVFMFWVSIWVNKGKSGAQPNSTEHNLDKCPDRKDEVRSLWYNYLPHQYLWNCDLERQNHSKFLAKTIERFNQKRIVNVLYCRIQVAMLWWAMKSKRLRKQKVRVMSRM